MKLEQHLTPAHRHLLCAGVFFCTLLSACENGALVRDQKDRTLELVGDTIELPANVDLHDVIVRTADQYKDFDPPQLQARPGDYVRFTTGDSRTHAIVFEVSDPQQRTFLESKAQLRSPPLVSKGTSWVVALENAPAGTYGFRCLVHDDRGQLVVGTGGR